MNRFSQNYYGNEAIVECTEMMPNRFDIGSDDEEEEIYNLKQKK